MILTAAFVRLRMQCYERWEEILKNCPEDVRSEMFAWFTSHLSCDYVMDYLEEYIEDFLMREFRDREMLEKKLKYLDEIIEKQGPSTDGGSTWSEHYGYEDNLIRRLELMEQTGLFKGRNTRIPQEALAIFSNKKNWRFRKILTVGTWMRAIRDPEGKQGTGQ